VAQLSTLGQFQMQTSSEFKKRLWIKYSFFIIVTAIFYSLVYYLFNRIAGETVIEPFMLLLVVF
jgi:hypothetical protein